MCEAVKEKNLIPVREGSHPMGIAIVEDLDG